MPLVYADLLARFDSRVRGVAQAWKHRHAGPERNPEEFLSPIARVVEAILAHADDLRPDYSMVGASRHD